MSLTFLNGEVTSKSQIISNFFNFFSLSSKPCINASTFEALSFEMELGLKNQHRTFFEIAKFCIFFESVDTTML